MSDATDHYERLLADHYTWMFGSAVHEKAAEQRELLARLGVGGGGDLAVDLGAGSGFQTLALADLGYRRVIAIDTSRKLLEELRTNVAGRPAGAAHSIVQAVEADMLDLPRHVSPGTADVIVCMGDTLTHLPAREHVTHLFTAVSASLRRGGRFVLSYRDLSSELLGPDRFIPVRSTTDKIMTCFLEYLPGRVMVHDLIHLREDSGWKLLKSCYPKLRLPVNEIRRDLENSGLHLESQETIRGMAFLAAQKR
jgi:SAM-dependent methyltransferase